MHLQRVSNPLCAARKREINQIQPTTSMASNWFVTTDIMKYRLINHRNNIYLRVLDILMLTRVNLKRGQLSKIVIELISFGTIALQQQHDHLAII